MNAAEKHDAIVDRMHRHMRQCPKCRNGLDCLIDDALMEEWRHASAQLEAAEYERRTND